MLSTLLAIARNAFLESIRQPVFLVILLLAAVFQILNTWIAGFSMGYRSVPGEVTGDTKLLFDVGLATVFVCGLFLAAFIATSVVSREIEQRTVLTVVSKPISRPWIVIGKYLGVAAALTIAVVLMLVMLLFALRHGVMSNASDKFDGPVLVFGLGSLALALLVGALGNFMFGWNFSQTTVLVAAPLILVAYTITLGLSPKWVPQPLTKSFLPQVTMACAAIGMALLVLAAVATAASTRLGQVMTIAVTAGVFVLGLLSNSFFGTRAIDNTWIARIGNTTTADGRTVYDLAGQPLVDLALDRFTAQAERFDLTLEQALEGNEFKLQDAVRLNLVNTADAVRLAPKDSPAHRRDLFLLPGATYTLRLDGPPTVPITPGMGLYYGASPNGLGLAVPPFDDPAGRTDLANDTWPQDAPPAVVVTAVDDVTLTVRHIGGQALPIDRPPVSGDYVFLNPTRINPAPAALWGLIPNMQSFWLVDAVSQAVPIPLSHLALAAAYALAQVIAFLSLAVLLFQDRDVG